MSKSTLKRFTANEKEISALLKENQEWKDDISYAAEEVNFFTTLLHAENLTAVNPDFEETSEVLRSRLENYKSENLELIMELHNHRYDIEGMMECEDIGCEVFYHEEHLKLKGRVRDFLERFKTLKLDVFAFAGECLRNRENKEG